jgi:hypothetical protein
VIQPAADIAAARRPDHDRYRGAPAVAKAQRRRLIDDLIEAARDEVGKLHFRHRTVAAHRRADAHADNRRLGNRRVDDPHLAELVIEPLSHAKRPAVRADIFPEHEHFRVAAHFFEERLADGFQIRQLFRHRFIRFSRGYDSTKSTKHRVRGGEQASVRCTDP